MRTERLRPSERVGRAARIAVVVLVHHLVETEQAVPVGTVERELAGRRLGEPGDLVDDDDYARFSFDVQSDGTPETYRLIYSYTGKDGVLREYDYEMVPGGEYLVAGLSNTLGIKVVSSDTEWSSSSNNFSNAGKNIMFTCSTHPTSGGSLELKGGCPYFSFNYETYKIPSVTVVETSYVG